MNVKLNRVISNILSISINNEDFELEILHVWESNKVSY